MIDHSRFRLLAATSIDESLGATDAAELERHLGSCMRCRSELHELRRDNQALAELRPVPTAAWVRESLLVDARGGRHQSNWLVLVAAVMVLVTVLVTGLVVGALLSRDRWHALGWTPVEVAVSADGSRIRTIVASGDGFVAGGATAAGAAVWWNPDGRRWSDPSPLPGGEGAEVSSLVGVGKLLVAAGRSPEGATVWSLTAGENWQRTVLPAGDGGGVNAIIAAGDGLVAVGWVGGQGDRSGAAWRWSPTGGWASDEISATSGELRLLAPLPSGGYLAIPADAGGGGAPARSTDGGAWVVETGDGALEPGPRPLLARTSGIAELAGSVYVVGTDEGGSLEARRSTDGRTWSEVDVPAIESVEIRVARAIDDRLLILGTRPEGPFSLVLSEQGQFDLQPVEPPENAASGVTLYDVAGSAGVLVAVGARGSDAAMWTTGK